MSIIFLWYLSFPVIRHYGELPEYKIFTNYARPRRYTHKSLIIVGEFLACLKSMAKLLSTSAKTGFHLSICLEGAIALTPTVSRCLCWQFQISFSLLSNILKMCFLLAHTDLSDQGGGCGICPNEIAHCWNEFPAPLQALTLSLSGFGANRLINQSLFGVYMAQDLKEKKKLNMGRSSKAPRQLELLFMSSSF